MFKNKYHVKVNFLNIKYFLFPIQRCIIIRMMYVIKVIKLNHFLRAVKIIIISTMTELNKNFNLLRRYL